MRGGIKGLLATAALATAGCASDSGDLKIRAVADPLTKAIKPGNPMIAEARGLLALGNVGLAIEAYRKVLISEPDSIEALAGLAECYDQMGRPDLSRAKYEAALAIAPKNAVLLRTFAASLERQGRRAEGQALRVEAGAAEAEDAAVLTKMASDALAPAPATPVVKVAPAPAPVSPKVMAAPVPAPTLVRVAAPLAAPAHAKVASALPPATPAPLKVAPSPPTAPAPLKVAISPLAAPAPVNLLALSLPTPPTIAAVLGAIHWKIENLVEPTAPSVTVKLPPARPTSRATERSVAALAAKPPIQPALVKAGARLERLSLGEVALVTSGRPQWQPLVVSRSLTSTTVRFVSLTPPRREAGVRLLNAARHEGLAARTRVALNRGGWNFVSIGDSARIRQKSLVLYSPATEKAARRLAAQFGFGIAREARPGPLTVLLGRDAIGRALARG